MKLEEVLEHYKSCYMICKQVGFSSHTPANWKKIGYIPAAAQARIQKHTNGKLKLNIDDLEPTID